MQSKSWAFTHRGHAFRTEINWNLCFTANKVLYIDHRFIRRAKGRFNCYRPLRAELKTEHESPLPIEICFKPRWFFFDMGCEVYVANEKITWTPAEVRIEKTTKFPELGAVGCAIIFPVMIIMAILLGPIMMIGVPIQRMQERRRIEKIRTRGRIVSWPAIERCILSHGSPTTLIVQLDRNVPRRVWWTTDDIPSICPFRIPEDIEDWFFPRECDHPFFAWVWHWYLSDREGKATLTDVPEEMLGKLDRPGHGYDLNALNSLYPSLRIVLSGRPPLRRLVLVGEFCSLLHEDPSTTLAELARAKPALRKMFLDAIPLMRSPPLACAEGLRHALYFGPDNERYSVVEALGALGPVGESILNEASICQDPVIREPAKKQRLRAEYRAKELERKKAVEAQ